MGDIGVGWLATKGPAGEDVDDGRQDAVSFLFRRVRSRRAVTTEGVPGLRGLAARLGELSQCCQ